MNLKELTKIKDWVGFMTECIKSYQYNTDISELEKYPDLVEQNKELYVDLVEKIGLGRRKLKNINKKKNNLNKKNNNFFQEQVKEIEILGVLKLCGVIEKQLHDDFNSKIGSSLSKKNTLYQKMNTLKQQSKKIKLESIVDVWEEELGKGLYISNYRHLLSYRHWIAHGRYFKEYNKYSFKDAFNISYEFIKSLDEYGF